MFKISVTPSWAVIALSAFAHALSTLPTAVGVTVFVAGIGLEPSVS